MSPELKNKLIKGGLWALGLVSLATAAYYGYSWYTGKAEKDEEPDNNTSSGTATAPDLAAAAISGNRPGAK